MNPLRKFLALFRRGKLDAEMSEEMRLHLEQRTRENLAAGMAPEEARYAALKKFGGVEQAKEIVRGQRSGVWLEQLGQDVRYGLRQLRRNPGFTAMAGLTLALGIGANTAMFSVVNAVLLRPLPYRDPDRLMMLDEKWLPRFSHFEATAPDFAAWREQSHSFDGLAGYANSPFNLTGDDRPERLTGARMTANLPAVLGVEPVLGRSFTAAEDEAGNDHVVLLSHRLWQRRFAGDPRVLGTAIRLNDASYTVVGVMPASFDFRRAPRRGSRWDSPPRIWRRADISCGRSDASRPVPRAGRPRRIWI